MKSLIIGSGQIGKALFEIFSRTHECYIRDVEPEAYDPKDIEVVHIAYPDGPTFVEDTLDYIYHYKPRLTIIHSTVAVGTTEQCGEHVVHSPERGRYPNLAKEMMLYDKFVGGESGEDIAMAVKYLRDCGWPAWPVPSSRDTELLKLLSNVHMGLEIAWRQTVERIGCNAALYKVWEESYRSGYMKAGQYNLIRPIMSPNPIGGHCILNCVEILSQKFSSKIFDFIKESNGLAKGKIEETSSSDLSSSNR